MQLASLSSLPPWVPIQLKLHFRQPCSRNSTYTSAAAASRSLLLYIQPAIPFLIFNHVLMLLSWFSLNLISAHHSHISLILSNNVLLRHMQYSQEQGPHYLECCLCWQAVDIHLYQCALKIIKPCHPIPLHLLTSMLLHSVAFCGMIPCIALPPSTRS